MTGRVNLRLAPSETRLGGRNLLIPPPIGIPEYSKISGPVRTARCSLLSAQCSVLLDTREQVPVLALNIILLVCSYADLESIFFFFASFPVWTRHGWDEQGQKLKMIAPFMLRSTNKSVHDAP